MKSYCNLPFDRIKLDYDGRYQSCCHQSTHYGNIIDEGKSLEELYKGQLLKEVKVATLNKNLHSMCNNNECPHYKTELNRSHDVFVTKYPKQIEFALSPRMCNIGGKNPTRKTACAMCPRSDEGWMKAYIDGTIPDRTDEMLKFIKPAMPYLEAISVLGIIEPFFKGQIFDVLDKLEFKKYREKILLWTFCNVTLFNPKVQKKYHEYVKKTTLGFSVDAATPETYIKVRKVNKFHLVKRNLIHYFKKCKEENRWDESFISNNINMWNLHELSDMVKFAKEVGAPHIQFSPTYLEGLNTQLPKNVFCNKDNWEIFDEAQTKAIEVGKEIGQSVQFYVPLHRGFKTGLYNQDLNQLKLINNV